jgi:dolichol-phosphate mannosyltransferase
MSTLCEDTVAHPESTKRDAVQETEILLTVLIPVYNEAATLEALLTRVLSAPYAKQVIVIDDGSTDGTGALLEKWRKHPEILVLRHPHNQGKGAAIRTGLAAAQGRFTIIQDADLEYDPSDYPRLIEPLRRSEASVVYGSRYLSARPRGASAPLWCRCGVALLNAAVRLLYGVRLTDEATCYKAFPTELLRRLDLQCRGFEFCPEVTAKVCRLGAAILEVPIHYHPRAVSQGKKIRWMDGVQALLALWKWHRWSQAGCP